MRAPMCMRARDSVPGGGGVQLRTFVRARERVVAAALSAEASAYASARSLQVRRARGDLHSRFAFPDARPLRLMGVRRGS